MIKFDSPEKKKLRLLAKFIDLASKQDPILDLAKSYYKDGFRTEHLDVPLMEQYCNNVYLCKFRNHLRDLEINFRSIRD